MSEINHNKIAAAHLAAAIIQASEKEFNKVAGSPAVAAARIYLDCYDALLAEGRRREAPNAVMGKGGTF